MVGVVARQGAEAVRAQELIFIEHLRQHAAELGFVQNRSQATAREAGLQRVVDRGKHLGTAGQEPLESLLEVRVEGPSSPSKTVAAQSGKRPTMDRTLSRLGLAVGQP